MIKKPSRDTKFVLLACLLLVLIACFPGGIGLAYERDLANNYSVWAADVVEQACIVKKEQPDSNGATCVVDSMVFAYGWNKRYIIAKQYPLKDDELNVDHLKVNWYIVDMKKDQVYGPMTEDDFLEARSTLDIPKKIDFTMTLEPKNNIP